MRRPQTCPAPPLPEPEPAPSPRLSASRPTHRRLASPPPITASHRHRPYCAPQESLASNAGTDGEASEEETPEDAAGGNRAYERARSAEARSPSGASDAGSDAGSDDGSDDGSSVGVGFETDAAAESLRIQRAQLKLFKMLMAELKALRKEAAAPRSAAPAGVPAPAPFQAPPRSDVFVPVVGVVNLCARAPCARPSPRATSPPPPRHPRASARN